MDNLNLVVMGKTGVGKSTLINAVLGKTLAPVGKGQAITRENEVYQEKLLLPIGQRQYDGSCGMVLRNVNLYDTVGLEIDVEKTKKTLNGICAFIRSSRQKEQQRDATLVWFCVNYNSNRFEKYELDLIRMLSRNYEIPFIIVLTQCISEEKGRLERQIEAELPEVTVKRVLARDYKLRGRAPVPAFGMTELIRSSVLDYNKNKVRILESKLETLAQDKEAMVDQMRKKGKDCVKSYGSAAIKVGILPVGCIPIVHGMCIKMICDLHRIFGINSTKGFASDIFANAVVGVIATPFMAVPVMSALMAGGYIQGIGEAYLEALVEVVDRSSVAELKNNSLMEQRIKDELKRRKK